MAISFVLALEIQHIKTK